MKAIDLTKALKPYSKGWVAIDEKTTKVVVHANTFAAICKKVAGMKHVYLVPIVKKYFGYVTAIHA